ncbi:uncharacterized protein LOC103697832 [Phoenix dactylifera]|uniref:Uncharacterized protein LOC103697832 n=1 Tax=Phoenix dactylifera TaxID=42345 RepID=A0A8B9A901_PHODC|nr:uncharacterized protein LOC103697832 [Phoenix dactylifera]
MASSCTRTEGVEEEKGGREWSQLPEELLELIAKKVGLLSDYIRFRSVCKSWHSAAWPGNLRPHPPILLLPHNRFIDSRSFFSLYTGKTRTIFVPGTSNKTILASSCGWMLLLDIAAIGVSLRNPVTGAQIQLPPPTSFGERPGLDCSYLFYRWEGFLSLGPDSSQRDWVVMVLCHDGSKDIHYCRPGDGAWSLLKANSAGVPSSVAYAKGQFFVLDRHGHLTIYAAALAAAAAEAAPPSRVLSSLLPPSTVPAQYYLGKASEAELLLLARSSMFAHRSKYLDNGVSKDFLLFKLDLGARLLEWSEINGIDGKALFLTLGRCSMARALSWARRRLCLFRRDPMASRSGKRGEEEEGPWSQLPTDLLELIAKKLALIGDYIHFRAVCKSWRSAALPANLRPQRPLLLLPYYRLTDVRPFFSLATNSVRILSLPESYAQVILASSHGWLLMLRGTALSLLNPVTRAQIRLPRPTDFYRPGCSAPESGVRKSISFIWNASLFSSPSSRAHDCVVTIMVHNWRSGRRHVHFCRPGDSVWTELKTDSPAPLDSVVYDEGRFYALDINGIVTVYAAATCTAIFSVPAPIIAAKFLLVKLSETELLLLARDSRFLAWDDDVRKDLKLFKLDLSGQLLRWSKIESIDDKALFSAEDHCSMICASDFPGCREDCIYFEAPYDIFQRFKSKFHHIEVLDIKNGSYEFICCRWEKPSNDSMKPIWFAPSLC